MDQKKKISRFFHDVSFLRWLKKGEPEADAEWEMWKKNNPGNDDIIADVEDIRKGIPFKKPADLPETATDSGWDRLRNQLNKDNTKEKKLSAGVLSIAAALLLLIGFSVAYFWQQAEPAWEQYNTTYGEMKTIELPDGSVVHLGANSALRYSVPFVSEYGRKVHLTGEAYFDVQPQDEPLPFEITINNLLVSVLGTSFNVNGHRPEPIVSLVEGSVELRTEDIQYLLKVGETAQFDPQSQSFNIKEGATAYWSDWRQGEWSFSTGIAMAEVIQRIEETYGFRCVVEDPSILEKMPAGKVSFEDPDVLFESLSLLLDIRFVQSGKDIVIQLTEE